MKSTYKFALAASVLIALVLVGRAIRPTSTPEQPKKIYPLGNAPGVAGVIVHSDRANPGYTLIAPMYDPQSYLIDLDGKVVNTWRLSHKPGFAAYLLDDGSLARTTLRSPLDFNVARGASGGVQISSWEGEVLWDYQLPIEYGIAHHDIEILPNGNVLLLAWVMKTKEELVAHGRDPSLIQESAADFNVRDASSALQEQAKQARLISEVILEIEPRGATEGTIVWKWAAWDHVVQSYDETKPNFGKPDENPGQIDINFQTDNKFDWLHFNAIDYHAESDQILISCFRYNEIWISITEQPLRRRLVDRVAGTATEGTCSIAGATLRHTTLDPRTTVSFLAFIAPTGFQSAFREPTMC